jgi:hypothetical protein
MPPSTTAATSIAQERGSRSQVRHECALLAAASPAAPAVAAHCLSASAAANSAADAKRSAGSFSSAFSSTAATCGGTDLRSAVTGCGCSVRIFMLICCGLPPRCGGWPASIS